MPYDIDLTMLFLWFASCFVTVAIMGLIAWATATVLRWKERRHPEGGSASAPDLRLDGGGSPGSRLARAPCTHTGAPSRHAFDNLSVARPVHEMTL